MGVGQVNVIDVCIQLYWLVFLKGIWTADLLGSLICQVYTELCSHISTFGKTFTVGEVELHIYIYVGSS